jgi:hypothetical protein
MVHFSFSQIFLVLRTMNVLILALLNVGLHWTLKVKANADIQRQCICAPKLLKID